MDGAPGDEEVMDDPPDPDLRPPFHLLREPWVQTPTRLRQLRAAVEALHGYNERRNHGREFGRWRDLLRDIDSSLRDDLGANEGLQEHLRQVGIRLDPAAPGGARLGSRSDLRRECVRYFLRGRFEWDGKPPLRASIDRNLRLWLQERLRSTGFFEADEIDPKRKGPIDQIITAFKRDPMKRRRR